MSYSSQSMEENLLNSFQIMKNQGIGGIFTYSAHVTLEFSQGFKMDLGPGFLEGNGKYRRHIKFRTLYEVKSKYAARYLQNAISLSDY